MDVATLTELSSSIHLLRSVKQRCSMELVMRVRSFASFA